MSVFFQAFPTTCCAIATAATAVYLSLLDLLLIENIVLEEEVYEEDEIGGIHEESTNEGPL